MFGLFPTWKIVAVALIMLGVAFGAYKLYDMGRRANQNNIEDQNNAAAKDAEIAAYSLDDCNAAADRGERVYFDFRSGKCRRAATNN